MKIVKQSKYHASYLINDWNCALCSLHALITWSNTPLYTFHEATSQRLAYYILHTLKGNFATKAYTPKSISICLLHDFHASDGTPHQFIIHLSTEY
jgi:hypothetical protein